MAKIVVLDDEAVSCGLISDLLAHRGHEVEFFTNPAKGILHIFDSPPDVVIADMLIAGMWGDHIVERILKLSNPPKFIGISYSWPGNLVLTEAMMSNAIFLDKTQFICRLSGTDPIAELNECTPAQVLPATRRANTGKSNTVAINGQS